MTLSSVSVRTAPLSTTSTVFVPSMPPLSPSATPPVESTPMILALTAPPYNPTIVQVSALTSSTPTAPALAARFYLVLNASSAALANVLSVPKAPS